MREARFVFTSESVTEGHPDKVSDQISDAILDTIVRSEAAFEAEDTLSDGETGKTSLADVRVAVETMVTKEQVFLAGELRTRAEIDIDSVVRGVIEEIGYNDPALGFCAESVNIVSSIHEQSADIARGVDESFEVQHANNDEALFEDRYERIGAGDQGMVFGYACTETPTFMPMPIFLAHRLAERLTDVRKDGTLPYLRPDGKVQVSVLYEDGKPRRITTILISTQHEDTVDIETTLRNDLIKHVITPILAQWEIDYAGADIYVNPTGRFVIGGPAGDTGLTGRKIIVDSYGGMARHGGGAFSGKDPTKVDRSATYAARWVAKNVVAAGLAECCEVQIAYGIGIARPLSLMIETFGTNTISVEDIESAVKAVFDLRPAAIIDSLNLMCPLYQKTSNYGHFGRELEEFTWERTDKVAALKEALTQK